MKIDRAIEILSEDLSHHRAKFLPDLVEAESLAIEALKREVNYRLAHSDVAPYLLPGESED